MQKKLKRDDYFRCPIWSTYEGSILKELNNASDKHIKKAKINLKHELKERNEKYGDRGDMGYTFQSDSLIEDESFQEFQNYIGETSYNLLDEMGFDLTDYKIHIMELWVQEFAEKGGGHHKLHTHWNGHMSGFYFLKAGEKTSMPVFHDPRAGNVMNLLPEKDEKQITYASSQVHYKVKSGAMMFFPSYMPHLYTVDMGYEPFRFIHFNCQAIPKYLTTNKQGVNNG